MDYTNEILKILSEELEPYISAERKVCIDGMLTSAQKLNEFIEQKLKQDNVIPALELLKQLQMKENEAAIKTTGNIESERHNKNCRDIKNISWLIRWSVC